MNSRPVKVFAMAVALWLAGTKTIVRADDSARTTISRESILGALHSSGIKILPGQMEQLCGITAAERNPQLKVLSVDTLDGESDKVLLHCEHSACLPFYVLVHWGQPGVDLSARLTQPAVSQAQPAVPTENLLVRSGRTVVLLLDGGYIHMKLPVLCLQNGGRGQRVRVISKETRRRYVAWVTGPGVVTSTLSN